MAQIVETKFLRLRLVIPRVRAHATDVGHRRLESIVGEHRAANGRCFFLLAAGGVPAAIAMVVGL